MANKKITDATQISTMSGSDKLFVNSGDDLKQITLDQAVAASTPVQQLNSNIEFSTLVNKAKNLEPNTDLNTITTSGIYYLLNATTWGNAPNTKVTNSYLIVIAVNTKRCTQILLPGNDTAIYIRSTYTDNTLWTNWKSNNTDIEIKNCFCKNIASIMVLLKVMAIIIVIIIILLK